MTREELYNIISNENISPIYLPQDLLTIENDCLVLQKMSSIPSTNSSVGGWEIWTIYVYSPSNPLHTDKMCKQLVEVLTENDIEVVIGGGQDYYDVNSQSYISTVQFRIPKIFINK